MKKLILFTALTLGMGSLWAQGSIDRIEPPNWWVGMADPTLQLMLHGEQIGNAEVSCDHPAIVIQSVESTDNPNYLFVRLDLSALKSAAQPVFTIRPTKGKKLTFTYAIKARRTASAQRNGFNNSDVIYLISPDRFANGNPGNDEVAGMLEGPNRDFKGGRHGGDIQGIRDHLDYIADMGFTAIWSCPLVENQQPEYSYHGYSTTDFYRIDPRMGTLEDYKAMTTEAHALGIKMVMDQIMNHIGSGHWWMQDHPSSDWVNNGWEYKWNKHYRSVYHDPYNTREDSLSMTDGWFVQSMPDLNQRNPLVARYLIQNSIWWVEEADLDGIRMDTYPYSEKQFMHDWSCALMREYPNFNIVGEQWTLNPAYIAPWQRSASGPEGSCLPSLFDFPLQRALVDALVEEESWWGGWFKLYEALAQDFQYEDPASLVTFPDNHDMDRFYRQIGEDLNLYKLGMAYLATVRGIPQIYYGTELLFVNSEKDDHGTIRIDFPGGWAGDTINGFTREGLSTDQLDAQAFTRTLLQWRKTASAVHQGKLEHYGPVDGVYVYFRYDQDQRVMVILNKNTGPHSLDMTRFAESMGNSKSGTDVLSGVEYNLNRPLELPPRAPLILELK